LSHHREQKTEVHAHPPATNLVAAETLRKAAAPVEPPASAKIEERLSVFWRVFGATILSIAALVCLTIYQQFNTGINDLRKDLDAERVERANLIKKDDLDTRLAPVWTSIKDAAAYNRDITALKERCAMLQEQLTAAQDASKAMSADVQQITTLKDRCSALEEKLKDSEAARAALSTDLQKLRELVIRLESKVSPPTFKGGGKGQ
jgi:DNA repair exonuclease SbcCD ATPase subunit